MSGLIIRVLVALITFTFGLMSAKLGAAYRSSVTQFLEVEVKKAPGSNLQSQPLTFECGNSISAFQFYCYSSDGEMMRYGCYERESSDHASRELLGVMIGKRIIEHTTKLSDKGERVGERVVMEYLSGAEIEAGVVWTKGSNIHHITARSLKYALEFERSQAWAGKGCFNFKLMSK